MILIKITKEYRVPKVGEWYCSNYGNFFKRHVGNSPLGYLNCKALSLSVILDAPDDPKDLIWAREAYPISNSEEIFQWLHDHGKLGEEWVEWPSPFDATWNGSPENGVFLFKTPYDIKLDRSKPKADPSPIRLLRKLADLQNGPPLERDRQEWEETMKEVYECLEKYNI